MGLKTPTVAVVVLSLIATAAMGPAALLYLQGDVNGDGRVDVLDAQLLVSQVVTTSQPKGVPRADANRDGQVNVLDLQYTLARVNGAPEEQVPAPADSARPKGTASRAFSWSFLVILAVAAVQFATVRPRPAHPVWWPPRALPSSTQRYLFTLTPHAPPALS